VARLGEKVAASEAISSWSRCFPRGRSRRCRSQGSALPTIFPNSERPRSGHYGRCPDGRSHGPASRLTPAFRVLNWSGWRIDADACVRAKARAGGPGTRPAPAELGVGLGRRLSDRGYRNSGTAPERVPVACARMIASSWAPNRNTIAEM
jgi:hypothetical protein